MTRYQCQECGWTTAPGDADEAAFEKSRPERCPYCGAELQEVLVP